MGTSVSFSADELVALARRLGLPPLPVLGPGPLDDLEPAIRERVLDAADRSLVARNVIDADNGTVLHVIASLLEIIARPRVLARVARRYDAAVATSYFAAAEDATVEIRPRAFGVHELRPFPTVDLLAAVLDAAGLEQRASVGDEVRFEVDHAALVLAYESVARVDRTAASDALLAAGVEPGAVDGFLGHEPRSWAMATVAVVHRPTTQRIEGGEVTVIDTRDRGLWNVTRISATRVTVERATLEPIARDLLDMLPTA